MDSRDLFEREISPQERRHIQQRRRERLVRKRKKQLLCFISIVIVICFIVRCATKSPDTTDASESSAEQSVATTPDATVDSEPAIDPSAQALLAFSKDDWNLVLINDSFYITEEIEFESAYLDNNMRVDSRIYEELTQMLHDGTQAGLSFIVCSAYRTISYQESLFNERLAELYAEGMTHDEAYNVAKTSIAVPGTSEHHLGLAVDIISDAYRQLDEQQSATPEYQWLRDNSYKYGFIVRYPEGRSDITGFIYEPWHFRYVGVEAATYITEHDLSLEEFLDLL